MDTGASCTIIKASVADTLVSAGISVVKTCSLNLSTVNDEQINVLGTITLPFKIGNRTYYHRVIICDGVTFPGAVLLGTDFLRRLGTLALNFKQNNVIIHGCAYQNIAENVENESLVCSMTKLSNKDCSLKVASITNTELISKNTVSIINVRVPYADGTTVLVDGNLKDGLRAANTLATVTKG